MSEICGICRDEKPDFITRCSHHFHHKCFLLWFMENNTCPFCRTRTSNVKRIENALRNYKCNPDSPESLGKLIKKDLIELFKDPPAHPYELKFESMIDALLKFGVNLNEPLYKKSKKLISIACEEGNISRVLYLITKGGVDINMSDFHSRNYPICIAVETGNMYLFNLLVERGADLKVRNQFDQSLLSSGCCAARSAIVKRLFELTEWDVNECGRLSYTPLHHVSEKFWFGSEGTEADRVSIAEMLLAKGADINATDSDRSTPLYITASAGYLDLVELLLEHGANVNQTKRSNLAPLLAASKAGHLEIVKKLIEHGANVKARDTTRFNSLHHACKFGCLETIKILAEKGCDLNSRGKKYLTPLHLAAESGRLNVVKFLLEQGAFIDAQTEKELQTPLLLALYNGHAEVAMLLIDSGADIDLENWVKDYPIHVAIENSLDSVAFKLLDKGCQFELGNMNEETPFDVLCNRDSSRPNYRLGMKLLKLGTDPDNTGEAHSETPLLNLCYNFPDMKLVSAIIKYGADINARDDKGKTALHRAVFSGNSKLVKTLIELGADVNATDSKGRYPIHYVLIGLRDKLLLFSAKAEYRKFSKVIEALASGGVDMNAQTKKGATAFHYVRFDSELRLLKRFAELGADIFKCDRKGRDLESRAKARKLKNVLKWIKTLKKSQ